MLDVHPSSESDTALSTQQEVFPVVSHQSDQYPVPWAPQTGPNIGGRARLLVFLVLLTIVLGSVTLALGNYFLVSPTAVVVIAPGVQNIQATITVPVAPAQLSSTVTRHHTVTSTGIIRQPARRATGWLTFYNIATFPQTIPAGSVVADAHGVRVATNAPATVQAGNPPAEASVTVSAHALSSGTAGNIPSGDIGMLPCCENIGLNGIVVANANAFSGGVEAATYPVLDQRDVDSAAQSLGNAAQQVALAQVAAQVPSHMQLFSIPACEPHVDANPPVGSRSAQSSVTMTETCRGQAYSQDAARQMAIEAFVTSSTQQPLQGYRLQVSGAQITGVSPANQGKDALSCAVLVQGRWIYQLDPRSLVLLKQHIAGLSYPQARAVLQHTVGVRLVALRLSEGSTLPDALSQINVAISPLI
jgi:Baseplate J-like protein